MANLLTKTSKMACHSWSLPAGPDERRASIDNVPRDYMVPRHSSHRPESRDSCARSARGSSPGSSLVCSALM